MAEAEANNSRRTEGAAAGWTVMATRSSKMLDAELDAERPVLQASRGAPLIAEIAFADNHFPYS